MKQKLLLFAILATLTMTIGLISCSKSDDTNTFRTNFTIINHTGDTYKVVITGYNYKENFTMSGNQTTSMLLSNGMYNIDVEQLDGYWLYPTTEKHTININDGSNITLELPNKVYK